MTDFKDFLAEQLQDPEILAEYQALESEYNRMQAMYKLQAELERGYQIGQKEGWLSVDEVERPYWEHRFRTLETKTPESFTVSGTRQQGVSKV